MGDVGSLALGGGLGVVAVLLKQEMLLLFIGGVYVIEALSVILQVGSFKLRGKRIFKMAPLHHHFEALGWPESKVIIAVLDRGSDHGAVRADDFETAMNLEGRKGGGGGDGAQRRGGGGVVARARRGGARGGSESEGHRWTSTIEPQTDAAFVDAELIVLSPGVPADLEVVERSSGARGARDRRSGTGELVSAGRDRSASRARTGKRRRPRLRGTFCKRAESRRRWAETSARRHASMVETSRAGQWNVLELSSFQLETTETFRAHIGGGLNVTPDHLDRHYTLENYAEAKARLFVQSARRRILRC